MKFYLEEIPDLEGESSADMQSVFVCIPLCSYCKKTKAATGGWRPLLASETRYAKYFSHGICPDCAKKLFPDLPELWSDEG